MTRMFFRDTKTPVDFYGFNPKGMAIIFDSSLANKNNGNGWRAVKISRLVPIEYFDMENQSYMSKTERNEIKNQLVLISAEWQCTDGTIYDKAHLEDAISHQRILLQNN